MYDTTGRSRLSIRAGATVWSADGKRLGTVIRCQEDGFVLEAGFLGRDAVLDYACLASSDETVAFLVVPSHEVSRRARLLEVAKEADSAMPPPLGPSASAVRDESLALHARLREALRDALDCANRVLGGERAAELVLRHAASTLARAVREHVDVEDSRLGPVLATLDAWGAQRRARLDEHHRSELTAVEEQDEAAHGLDEPEQLARGVRRAIVEVLKCLRREERELLDADLLSDDLVRPDQTTG